MEKHVEFVRGANKYYDIADHMLFVTFPLVNDTKIILTIVENLYKSLINGIDALIHHNYLYKRVSRCPQDIEGKIEMFKLLAEKYGFSREVLVLLKDLKSLLEHRKKSPVEFPRGRSHVLADKNFQLRLISFDKAKRYCRDTKLFVEKVNRYFEK